MDLTNIYLRMLTEASKRDNVDEEEENRRRREAEAQELEAEAEENNAEAEAEAEDAGETEEGELPPDDGEEMTEAPPEEGGDEPPPEQEEGEDPLGDVGDFSMEPEVPDPDSDEGEAPPGGGGEESTGGEEGSEGQGEGGDDMSDVPAPDGLPEADDDGSGDQETPQEEVAPEDQTVQTVILKMSKLDRQLGKITMYDMLSDLRASIQSVLSVVDKNETVIDPSVRETYIKDLNRVLGDLETYIKYKFKKTGLEDSIVNYFEIVQKVSSIIGQVQDNLAASRSRKLKHNNNQGMYGPASDM